LIAQIINKVGIGSVIVLFIVVAAALAAAFQLGVVR